MNADLNLSALATSFWVVAVSEIGDKTQLLSIWLGLKYQRPTLLIGAIAFATIANHAAAAWLGLGLSQLVQSWNPNVLPGLLAALFVLCGLWALRADSFAPPDESKTKSTPSTARVFWFVAGLFFLAEMGDKTQVATTALAADLQRPWSVALATSTALVFVNLPAVLFGKRLSPWVQRPAFRWVAAASFFAVAAAILINLS